RASSPGDEEQGGTERERHPWDEVTLEGEYLLEPPVERGRGPPEVVTRVAHEPLPRARQRDRGEEERVEVARVDDAESRPLHHAGEAARGVAPPVPQPSSRRRARPGGSRRRSVARSTARRPRNHQCRRSSSTWVATYAGSIPVTCQPRGGRRHSPSRGEKPAEPGEPLPDAVERRGVREPDIPFSVGTEGRARRHRDVHRLEDLARETHRVHAEVARVGEHVEGARRLTADAEPKRAEARDHHAPPFVEDGAEAVAP